MMRAVLLALLASLFAFASVATETASSRGHKGTTHERIAKGPRKGAKADKKAPPEQKAPENARIDPRAAAEAPSAAPAAPAGEARRGMSRIEFDDRLVQGQTNKANAIYLFERRESALRSLLKKRTDFHEEIDETLE